MQLALANDFKSCSNRVGIICIADVIFRNKRSIRAYEAALGVSFNLDSRSDDNGNSSELAKGQLVPCFVRADAKYGGQKTDLFNESATDELLAGLAAALGASGI